ncbi:MAG TPA: hypothetical protein PLO67_19655 [Saprospiraceae bacterium]|nr:hypothetical protein [Saprospiraceae bacterium]HPI07457.1 hypothetical protein [Saprospiraceae bacterium]
MAKTPSDKLHRLIRSLSPAEKRYFRIYIRGKTERASKYLQLFDLMAAQEVFNEDNLRTGIYKNQPPGGKKYSELKSYLYNLILKSLQAFDEQHSVEFKLNELLQGVSALYKRGLYADCRELLLKAAKIARQYEDFSALLEIIRWEKQLAYTRMDVDFLHKNLEQLQFQEEQALQHLRNTSEYQKAFFQVYTTNFKREAGNRNAGRMAPLHDLIGQNEAFNDPDRAASHKARVLFYRTLNIYYYATGQYEQFYESGQKLMFLLESQPHFLKQNLADYIATLSNLILSCGLLQRYREVRIYLEKLHFLTPITEDDRRKIHRQYYSNLFALCSFTGEFEEARREMARCQEEAERMSAQGHETASFYFQYCTICFGCRDFNGALDYLNMWLSQPRSVEREDLQSLARILSLILHFEMGNLMLLESLTRSATRFMQKKNRYQELERRFIHFIHDLMKAPGQQELRAGFQKVKEDLPKMSGYQELLQTFDLEAWLDSKIKGQTFAATVQEKWEKQGPRNN